MFGCMRVIHIGQCLLFKRPCSGRARLTGRQMMMKQTDDDKKRENRVRDLCQYARMPKISARLKNPIMNLRGKILAWGNVLLNLVRDCFRHLLKSKGTAMIFQCGVHLI